MYNNTCFLRLVDQSPSTVVCFLVQVINTMKMIARVGPDSFGAYIISMARTASDVLHGVWPK